MKSYLNTLKPVYQGCAQVTTRDFNSQMAFIDWGVFHKAIRKVTHDFTNDLYMKSQMGCSIIIDYYLLRWTVQM